MQIYADMDRIDRIESDMANGLKPGYEQVSEWMETLGDERLYELARRIRMRRDGRRIDMCSIMNARSGRCSEDCKWCAQSKFHKTDIEVYPLVGEQEAVREAAHNASKGVRRFSLVTSGRALSDGETDRVCGIYRRIGSEVDISLCASLGLLSKEQLVRLRQSGVRRYHCNLETALRISESFARRIRSSRNCRRSHGPARRGWKSAAGVSSAWARASGSASSSRWRSATREPCPCR